LLKLGNAAADCLARSIMRAVLAAEPLGGGCQLAAVIGAKALLRRRNLTGCGGRPSDQS